MPGRPANAVPAGDEKKKYVFVPWHGGAGAGVLVLLFVAFKSMTGGSSASDDDGPAAVVKAATKAVAAASSSAPTSPGSTAGAGGSAPVAEPIPFTIVAAPNPRQAFGTMAIVARQPTSGGAQAAALAAFARNQLQNPGRWQTLHIYVFSDAQNAQSFAEFMAQRQGRPLEDEDYSRLSSLWGTAVVCYQQLRGGAIRVVYPQRDPTAWWRRSGSS